MASLGKRIAGMFVEIPDEQVPAQSQPVPKQVLQRPVQGSPATAAYQPQPEIDPNMVDVLQKKIAARATPFTALLENVKNLEDVIPDETTRFKAAYKTIARDGSRTVSSIAQAIDVHVSDIEGERMRFRQTTEQQIQAKSGSLRSQAKALESTNSASAAEIERLQANIMKLQDQTAQNSQKISELSSAADAAELDIKNTAEAFERAVDYVKSDLLEKKTALTTMLS